MAIIDQVPVGGIISFYHSFHKTRRNEPRHEKTVFFVCKQQQCATRRPGECLRSLPGLLHEQFNI